MDDDLNLDNVQAETSFEIQLYIYDLSRILSQISEFQLPSQLSAIWHTSLVAYGREYFFSGKGIESCLPGATSLGEPHQIIQLGVTELSYSLFLEYLFSLGSSSYSAGTYDLYKHSCNDFTSELANLLLGKSIPRDDVDLPKDTLDESASQTLLNFINSYQFLPPGSGAQLSGPKARQRKFVRSQDSGEEGQMAEAAGDDSDVQVTPRRRSYKYSDPLFVRPELNGATIAKELEDSVLSTIEPEKQAILKEWTEFVGKDNGGWSLEDAHLNLLAELLNGSNDQVTQLTLKSLQVAALKDEFVLLLHQDRREHRLMSFMNTIEEQSFAVQTEIIKFALNLCSFPSSFDWLMYISEWFEANGSASSNSRVTIRIAVQCLLNRKLPELNRLGLELFFNISVRELFDDVASELSTAVFQFLQDAPTDNEDNLFIALTCVSRFLDISPNEIAGLAKMLGPDFDKFKGKSERVDKLITEINTTINNCKPIGF